MKSKQELISNLLRHVDSAGPILDIGFAQEPNDFLSGEVYGIDIYEREPPNYKETKRVDLNIERIPYDNKFFGSVILGCTLAHIANPLAVVAEANRVLKDNGYLIVTSPNPYYYWEIVLNIFFRYFRKRVIMIKFEEHFYSFSRFDMRALLSRTGFTIQEEWGYLFALIKIPIRFNPVKYPGIAYEIIYCAKKTAEPAEYTTYKSRGDAGGGIKRIPTKFRHNYVSHD